MCQGLHVRVTVGLSNYINCIAEYIVEKGLHAPEIGGLNVFIRCIV
jgi:hypothetical protein